MASFAPNAVQDQRLNEQQQPYTQLYRQNEQEQKPGNAQQPQASGPQPPQQSPTTGQSPVQQQQTQTFQQMRESGLARPPAPQAGTADMQYDQSNPNAQGSALNSQASPNGFNGQAPNFSPLDYYIGQAMGVGAPQSPQFSQYQAQGAPAVQQAQNYSASPVNFAASAPGISTDVRYNRVDTGEAGTFDGGTSIGGAAEQQVRNVLSKPSGWDSDLLRSLYETQGREIDDQFNAQDVAINEEMARRGLYDSSIAAGRLKDSNIGRRDAQTRLSENLLQQMGLNLGQDNARAAQIGTDYQGQQFAEGRGTFEANEQAKRAVIDQQMEQSKQEMNAMVARGELTAKQAQMQLEAQRMNLDAQLANAVNNLSAAQLNSQNTNNYNNASLNAAQLAQQDRQFGTTSNNNAAQQTFNNAQTNLGNQNTAVGNIVNYGQSQFNNDMTQQQFNALLAQQEWQRQLDAMGLK